MKIISILQRIASMPVILKKKISSSEIITVEILLPLPPMREMMMTRTTSSFLFASRSPWCPREPLTPSVTWRPTLVPVDLRTRHNSSRDFTSTGQQQHVSCSSMAAVEEITTISRGSQTAWHSVGSQPAGRIRATQNHSTPSTASSLLNTAVAS